MPDLTKPGRASLPEPVVERLFLRLWGFYGSKLADAYPGIDIADLRAIWAEELVSYTVEELQRGVRACRQLKWPPTLPEFMQFCRPWPSPETAYHEAVRNVRLRSDGENPAYSHPAVFWAACEIGGWDMAAVPQRQMMPRWTDVLNRHLQSEDCRPVPPPPLRLPEPVRGRPNPLVASKIAALAAKMRAGLKRGKA